jgi:O-antigen biosynthesis protein WbqP
MSKAKKMAARHNPSTVLIERVVTTPGDRERHVRPMTPKRWIDLSLVIASSPFVAIVMFVVAVAVRLSSPGPVLHWSARVGRGNSTFWMPKFRTMTAGAPQLATHLLGSPKMFVTPIGRVLRRYSLDELPQLLSVIKGEMSLVGPRPALFNQYDLIELRTNKGIHALLPGITGWAQINGRDDLCISTKLAFEEQYLQRKSVLFDLQILLATLGKVLRAEGVRT